MYTVYADENNIYNPTIESLEITNTKLELELNKVGSFSFTIPPTNPYINQIIKMKTLINVYEDSDLIFRGRVLNDQETFNKSVMVKCEGELAFLNDSIQRPFSFAGTPEDLFILLIERHNEQVDDFKKFKVGIVTVTDPNNYINRSDTQYSNTLTLINDMLINKLGGYVWFRHEKDGIYIDYLKDFTTLNRQPIKFGENLLDINKYSNAKDIATVIIPLGANIRTGEGEEVTEARLTIESVNNGLDYIIDEEAVELRGRIVNKVIFEDVTEPLNLLRKGKEFMAQSILLINSFELTAVDLSSLNQDFKNFKMGSYVYVETLPHDIDSYLLVQKLSIDLQKTTSNKIKIGKTSNSMTDIQNNLSNNYDKYGNVVSKVENINSNVSGIIKDNQNMNNEIIELEKQMTSSILQSKNEISQEISESYYTKDDTKTLIDEQQTAWLQTKEMFEMQFNKFIQDLDALNDSTSANFEDIRKYIRFNDGKIILGQVGNELELRIVNNIISFIQSNHEVAFFSNSKLSVTDIQVLTSLRIGDFAFEPRENGSLDFG